VGWLRGVRLVPLVFDLAEHAKPLRRRHFSHMFYLFYFFKKKKKKRECVGAGDKPLPFTRRVLAIGSGKPNKPNK
jgi:hypothetical protein